MLFKYRLMSCNVKRVLFPSGQVKININQTDEPFNIDEVSVTPRTKRMRNSLSFSTKMGRPTSNK